MKLRIRKPGCAREWAALILGAAVYALLYALGSQIDQSGATKAGATLVRFAGALPVAAAALLLFFSLPAPCIKDRAPEKKFPTALAFAAILACYLPMFLTHYPGSFMYDTQRQVFQIARNEYEMFHPLLHTLLIRFSLSFLDVLGSFEKCAALYSVIQMTIVSLCFALLCASAARCVSRRAGFGCAVFFALYPAHMAFAGNCTKDGLFAAFFALFLALSMEDAHFGGLPPARRLAHVISGVLACLMRNNMIYAVIAWMFVLLLRRRRYLRLAAYCALVIVLSRAGNAGLAKMTNAAPGSAIEMFSVPIQQLSRARLLREDCFTESEKALMDEVFVDALYGESDALYERYEPTLADPVKNYIDEELFKARLPQLAAMWASVGGKCPGVYLDAFLNLALPSLYPYSHYSVAQPYIETGLQPGVVTAPFGAPPMTSPSRFAGLRAWLYDNIFSTGADHVPVLRLLFNTGAVYWLLLALFLKEMHRGAWRQMTMLALPLLLYATYLLGPVMQGRYLYPFICVLPLFVLRPAADCSEKEKNP
ncbi:MAG: DUF6020 family protein [Eubacteriales bacterium]|nr:DUF6020 family protein [Eubacteriales bacterium]